jgi:hypothetical protein
MNQFSQAPGTNLGLFFTKIRGDIKKLRLPGVNGTGDKQEIV